MVSPYEIGRRSEVVFDLVTDKFYRGKIVSRTVRGFEIWDVGAIVECEAPDAAALVTVIHGIRGTIVPIGSCTVRELGVCPNSYYNAAMGVSLEWKDGGKLQVNGKVLPDEAVAWLKARISGTVA